MPYYRRIVGMLYSVKGQHQYVVAAFIELAEVLYQSSQYTEYFRVCKDTVKFTFNMEGEFDQMFPGVFASTSTDVAMRDESFLSGFVSNFPSLDAKKLKSSIQKPTLILTLVLMFVDKAPLFIIPFCLLLGVIFLVIIMSLTKTPSASGLRRRGIQVIFCLPFDLVVRCCCERCGRRGSNCSIRRRPTNAEENRYLLAVVLDVVRFKVEFQSLDVMTPFLFFALEDADFAH